MKHFCVPKGWTVTDKPSNSLRECDGAVDPATLTIHIFQRDSWIKDYALVHELAHARWFCKGHNGVEFETLITHETIAFHRALSHFFKEHQISDLTILVDYYSELKNSCKRGYPEHAVALQRVTESALWSRCLKKLDKESE